MTTNRLMSFLPIWSFFYIQDFFQSIILYPIFLYNFIERSFSYARVENRKLVIEKVNEREVDLPAVLLTVDSWVL